MADNRTSYDPKSGFMLDPPPWQFEFEELRRRIEKLEADFKRKQEDDDYFFQKIFKG